MPAQTIFFVGDKLHASQSAASIHSVSSTENGYNMHAVRDTSWKDAWKPVNGTADEYLQIDGGSAGWLGTTGGDPIHWAIAYDARGADQTLIKVNQDAADAVGGAFVTIKGTFATLGTNRPTEDYLSFLLTGGGKRYYRVYQFNADRGGGTKTVPIYAIAVFTATEVHIIDTEYLGNSPGPGEYGLGANVGLAESAGGMEESNVNGPPYQEVEINFGRATQALWDAITSHYMTWNNGSARPIWLQYEGLYNDVKADFAMVRQMNFASRRPQKDQYDTRLQFRTVGKPI